MRVNVAANNFTTMRKKITLAAIIAFFATLITWLVLSENSPFDNYFLYHVGVKNFVARLVFVPYALLLLTRAEDGSDLLTYALVFLQWLILALIITVVVARARVRK